MATTLVTVTLELEVEYTFIRGCPMRMHMPNGDPGYPAEPDDIEVEKVFVGAPGASVEIGDYLDINTLEEIEQAVMDAGPEEDEPNE